MAKKVGKATHEKLAQNRYRMVVECAEILLEDENWTSGATIPELATAMMEELSFRIDQVYLFRSLRSNSKTFSLRESGQTYHVKLKPGRNKKK